ncbi:hypothetical protein MSKU15_2838 [Komagataeibacter diospyri]|nr:hypothetical protein MSKU15_2838 [Komagataeibacter diospyri]
MALLRQTLARFVTWIPTGQYHDTLHARVPDQVKVEIGLFRDRDLDHHLIVTGQRIKPTVQSIELPRFYRRVKLSEDEPYGREEEDIALFA